MEKKLNSSILKDALTQSFVKLSPRVQVKNPVMFVVYIGAVLISALYILSFLVYGAVCQFRGSHRRRAWQSAGQHPPQSQKRRSRTETEVLN